MTGIWFRSAAEAARMLRDREISSRELTEAVLARIDEINPRLTAVVQVARESALVAADEADRAIARAHGRSASSRTEADGRSASSRTEADGRPLLGLPVTVKEAFRVTGLHSTWGLPAFRDHVADRDATVVRRLRRAGAVVVGTSNVPTMLGDFGQSANEIYGATANPWDPGRAPGGSSGGGAAAVAAGLSFLEYGSDLAGSIRIPAAFCGVYGLKPTAGTVPASGFQPPYVPDPVPSDLMAMTTLGPLARTAGDLRTAFVVTGGPETPMARAYAWSPAPPRHHRLGDVRVGVVFDHPSAPVDAEIAAALHSTVDALAGAGARIVEGWPSDVDPDRSYESFGFLLRTFMAFAQDSELEGAHDFLRHERRRLESRAAWGRYFEEVDVFLCPVAFTAAIPHDTRPFSERTIGDRPYRDLAFWISHASLPGLPVVSAPIGRTGGGLPIGVQIVGPLHEDDTAITVAELIEGLVGGYQPPPL
jgi:amidase